MTSSTVTRNAKVRGIRVQLVVGYWDRVNRDLKLM